MPFKLEYNSNFDNILVKNLNLVFQPISQPYFLILNMFVFSTPNAEVNIKQHNSQLFTYKIRYF